MPEHPQLMDARLQPTPSIACSTPGTNGHQGAGLNPQGFSLTSWNIYKQQKPGWDIDLQTLNAEADVLLLQEAYLDRGLQDWLGRHVAYWNMNPAFFYRVAYAGVMTTARSPFLAPCGLRSIEPLTGIPKTVLLTYHPIAGHREPLLVVNIHGINFSLGTGDLEAQFAAVSAIADKHKGPLIIAGDFNTWSRPRSELLAAMADELGLQGVSFSSLQPSERFGSRIDHVYYRGLVPLASRVTPVVSSDHRPLTVRFSLKG